MTGLWIWASALVAYAAFRRWYDGPRRPLEPGEIDHLMAGLERVTTPDPQERARVRAFLEQDDGREFAMLNLVRLPPEPIPHPVTGVPTPAMRVLEEYTKHFIPALLRRAGHPAIAARKIGGYLDAWNVPPDPGWTLVGYMRYRSRRDMMELVVDPRFEQAHAFKMAATPVTFSFPTEPRILLFVSPRIWVGLTIALLAALAHLAVLALR
jgi:hypothetical protein